MDTNAYLTRQGWRGNGFALHPSGHGIKKALLVSKRTDRLGVGKKVHDAHAEQWWSRAFDETLRSLNVEQHNKKGVESKSVTVIQTSVCAGKWNGNGGLYGNFVKGQGLKGTLGSDEQAVAWKPNTHPSTNVSSEGSARIENNAGEISFDQGPDNNNADRQTKHHSIRLPTFLPPGEDLTKSDSLERSTAPKMVPLLNVAKSTKSSKANSGIV